MTTPVKLCCVCGRDGLANWDDLMEPVRCAARRLVVRKEVVITQRGQVVARGPMLIRRA